MINLHETAAIIVHGGVGGFERDSDGCASAAGCARAELDRGNDALAAAIAAVVAMEDDGRFNAGSGAILGLDGETIEMDAAVMDSQGRLGAVACLRRVKNPVLVARDVAASPHRMLCGEGALRFARVGGHADYYQPSDKAGIVHRALISALAPDAGPFGMLWNYQLPPPEPVRYACDTVGAVVRDSNGHFGVAASTGGSAPALSGRVGDTPLVGSGFYAGKAGAVTVTGQGEQIIPHLLAHTVYQWLAEGGAMENALQRGLGLFASDLDIGIIAITAGMAGSASRRGMPVTLL
ncbi:isoaspartyl peptidase/L-asparaginase [Massilia sp. PAMC28688]|uniref:isoaspartyl peptidase/L-asparaginase n=1 Tax=Massilia sp. PAMC28688 TaxID=2861283 RepID=UPI001C62B206|nr:isoaspartyl peptidase/L-asparaginase [Massilia sp. PAMC28688]QYF94192.1 isoaspartyl peptidase/L-asparaginase [Massilia sp. PAMC28688]